MSGLVHSHWSPSQSLFGKRHDSLCLVYRRFQQWCLEEALRNVLAGLANTLREQGQIDEETCLCVVGLIAAARQRLYSGRVIGVHGKSGLSAGQRGLLNCSAAV